MCHRTAQNTHMHTLGDHMRLVTSNLPSLWRQRSREEEAFRKKRQRGGERRSPEAPSGDRRTEGKHTFLHTADKRFVCVAEQPLHNISRCRLTGIRAQTSQEPLDHGYKHHNSTRISHPSTARRAWPRSLGRWCGIYRSDPRAHLFVKAKRLHRNSRPAHLEPEWCYTDRPCYHMWMFFLSLHGCRSHLWRWKVSVLDSVLISSTGMF